MTDARVALVTGPQGLSGGAVVERLAARTDWSVVGCSRRPLAVRGVGSVTADLLNRDHTLDAMKDLADVTHLFFGAYVARAGDHGAEAVDNAAILTNTLDALRSAGADLQHVVLYHGGKAYGAHLGPFTTPAKESAPRIEGPLLYHEQEDMVRARGSSDGIGWTIFRPDWVGGATTGSPINLVLALGTYAVLCRELGQPLVYPGTITAGASLMQSTDSRLIGAASEWACESAAARNDIFNLTNGDAYRWQDMWGEVADVFGLAVDDGGPTLTEFMTRHGSRWAEVMAKHDLVVLDPVATIDWPTIDFAFSCGHDMISSTVKIRHAGFAECIDSSAMFAEQLHELARRRILPRDLFATPSPASAEAAP